jgi:N-acetylmuramoyl-L-alanine amidase
MNIIDHPSPNHSPRKPGVRVDTIVIHHTATKSSASGDEGALEWLCNNEARVSAHYLVAHDGLIYRLVPEHLTAWHAGVSCLPWEKQVPGASVNARSIGIEVVNPGDGKTPFTEAQYAALCWLVPDIVRRWGDGRPAFVLPRGEEATPGWMGTAMKLMRDGRLAVLGHRDVAPGRKTDPADNFDWSRIREALGEMPSGCRG